MVAMYRITRKGKFIGNILKTDLTAHGDLLVRARYELAQMVGGPLAKSILRGHGMQLSDGSLIVHPSDARGHRAVDANKQLISFIFTPYDFEAAKSNPRRSTGIEAVDKDAVRELVLYIENNGQLYRSQTLPIISNLQKKIAKGVYDPALALKLWGYLADSGAQRYFEEFGSKPGTWFDMFPPATRRAAAKELQESYDEHVRETPEQKTQQPGVYAALYTAGLPLDHHESDLYVKDSAEARRILKAHNKTFHAFRSATDGTTWLDVPFAYEPFWHKKTRAKQ